MKKQWLRFFWPMAGVLAVLIIFTVVSYWRGCAAFWNAFIPQFMATVFGVVISIILAWALWRHQQRAKEARLRQQLIEALKVELNENVKRLNDTKIFFNRSTSQRGRASFRPLRTTAAKLILKPENLLIVNDVKLEDEIGWMLTQIELYNSHSNDYLEQVPRILNMLGEKDITEELSKLWELILSEASFEFLQSFLKHMSKKIACIS